MKLNDNTERLYNVFWAPWAQMCGTPLQKTIAFWNRKKINLNQQMRIDNGEIWMVDV